MPAGLTLGGTPGLELLVQQSINMQHMQNQHTEALTAISMALMRSTSAKAAVSPSIGMPAGGGEETQPAAAAATTIPSRAAAGGDVEMDREE